LGELYIFGGVGEGGRFGLGFVFWQVFPNWVVFWPGELGKYVRGT